MYRFLAVTILSLTFNSLISQSFEWIKGRDIDYSFNPAMLNYSVEASGDQTVWFAGMKQFVEFYQEAMGDLFLMQYNQSGNLIQDLTVEGSALVTDIETDSDGNIYLAGDFKSDLTLPDGYILEFTGPFINSFLLKVSSQGSTEWAVNLASIHPDAVASDILVRDDRLLLAHSEWLESNITEFDTDGNFIRNIGQVDVGVVSSVALDEEGNLYATGSCPGIGSQFGGVAHPAPFAYSIYLVKYNPEGVPEWVHFVEDITCVFPRIITDQENNLVWAGALNLETTFDTITLLGPAWSYDLFVTRFNPEGAVQWGIEVPQVMTGDASTAKLKSIALLPDNSIAIGGFTRGVVDWGNAVVSDASGMSYDLMALNVSPDGIPMWVRTGGGTGSESAMAIDGDGQGNLYLAGVGHGTITFDSLSYSGQSFYYPFLVKLNTNVVTFIPDPNSSKMNLRPFPNPTTGIIDLDVYPSRIREILVTDLAGNTVINQTTSTESLNITHLSPGLYMITITTVDGKTMTGSIIKTN